MTGTLFSDPLPDLTTFDVIIVNSSAGKDSQAMLDYVVEQARDAGVLDRVTVFHADLGRMEWEGTAELAEEHATHYALRFEKIKRPQGDLLDQVRKRGMWPSSTTRYCTSDHKRGQGRKVMTKLVTELGLDRPARVLNCMGFRREESPARAKKASYRYDTPASGKGTVRQVWEWLPILEWTLSEVWDRIRAAGTRHHWAYDLGMPRLSCCFCVLSSRSALVLAAVHNPVLLAEYVAVEAEIGHTFQHGTSIADIAREAEAGVPVTIKSWSA